MTFAHHLRTEGSTAADGWLTAERFVYAPLDEQVALVRLSGALKPGRKLPGETALVIWRGTLGTVYCAREGGGYRGRRIARRWHGPVLYRASFVVPLHVIESRDIRFMLAADSRARVDLPVPVLVTLPELTPPHPARVGGAPWRYAAALAAGFAAAAALAAGPVAGATTDSRPTTTTTESTSVTTTTTESTPATTTTTESTPVTTTTTDSTPVTTTTTDSTPVTTRTPGSTTTSSTLAPPAPTATGGAGRPAPIATPPSSAGPTARHRPTRGPSGLHVSAPRSVSGTPTTGGDNRRRRSHGRPSPHHLAVPRHADHAALALVTITSDPLTIDPFTAAQIAHFESIGAGLDQPPAYLIPIYKAAGQRYHVPWQILAAINAIETDYGRDLSVSVAGAIGWMQFEPATWRRYGVSAHGSGVPNPYDPKDAIFSAARYLAANGAPGDLSEALFAYNHALWYVDAVLWRSELIADNGVSHLGPTAGYALPLDARYMQTLGRTDDGVDVETAPDGAAVYSITPGIVTAVASDPSGFGPNYPVILVSAGPLAGQYIYYGHVAASLVTVGQHVLAGQPIAVMGHSGNAVSLGHGHIEIGFSDGSGDPLNHGGTAAWTPAGDAMRRVLLALTSK